MAALPAPVPSGEYRALTLYDAAPEGCIIFPVRDHGSDPHLRFGEYGVVDTTDREPINGELYLIEWNSGRREFVQAWARQHQCDGRHFIGWWVGDLNRPRSYGAAMTALRAGTLTTCDGPYTPEHLIEKIVGRVVGVVA